MKPSKEFAFKETSFFEWDSEPALERPSEFAPSTLSFAPLPARRPKVRSHWLSVALVAGIGTLGVGTALLYGLVHMLHA
ncbi:MAG: hypothetical protein ABI887_03175 [Burkholderiales bacterium]